MSMSSKIRHRCFSKFIITFLFSMLLNMTEIFSIKERAIHSCLENTSTPLYNVGETTFCQCCGPGFYKIDDCVVSGEKAVCMPCKDGYYSNTSNQAIACSLCFYPPKCHRPNMEITQTCTRTTNYDCRCKDGYFFKQRQGSNGDGDCVKQACPPGTYMKPNGTSGIVCKPCEIAPDAESDHYKNSCSNLGQVQECDPKKENSCSEFTNKSMHDSSTWVWIIVAFAALLASMSAASIVLYWFRRRGIFDIVKFISEHICRRRVSRKYKKSNRKQWMDCIRWLTNIVNIKSWRTIIRSLFAETSSDLDGDSIILEVEANHPNDVREQIYRAFIKWYQLTDPRDVDLNLICNVLVDNMECELEQKLKTKFPDLLIEESETSTEDQDGEPLGSYYPANRSMTSQKEVV